MHTYIRIALEVSYNILTVEEFMWINSKNIKDIDRYMTLYIEYTQKFKERDQILESLKYRSVMDDLIYGLDSICITEEAVPEDMIG